MWLLAGGLLAVRPNASQHSRCRHSQIIPRHRNCGDCPVYRAGARRGKKELLGLRLMAVGWGRPGRAWADRLPLGQGCRYAQPWSGALWACTGPASTRGWCGGSAGLALALVFYLFIREVAVLESRYLTTVSRLQQAVLADIAA